MPMYCISCKSTKVQEIVEENKIFYQCDSCHEKAGKALVVDGKIKIIKTSRGIKHIDTAAIIIRNNRILLMKRRTYPFGLMIPAGHLEYNETLDEALKREVYEEVGLKVRTATLLSQLEQPVSYCRYGSDIEEWVVYLVDCLGEPIISNNENESILWVHLSKIPKNKLTPHTKFALSALGYIK